MIGNAFLFIRLCEHFRPERVLLSFVPEKIYAFDVSLGPVADISDSASR
jgi:hypothetical protein